MFARVFALLPLALLASATHLAARDSSSECSNSNQLCCSQSLQEQQTFLDIPGFDLITAVVGAALEAGITCSVLAAVDCTQQPVCCNDVEQNGLINVGCSPISVL